MQKPIHIQLSQGTSSTRNIGPIPAKSTFRIPMNSAVINKSSAFLISSEGKEYGGYYTPDVPEDRSLKVLHVGMITSRWVGAEGDYNIGKPGLNAVQGVPWLRIHNMTSQPLQLNENILIPPGKTLRYTGRDHFGVRLGTVFKDQSQLHPDFIFTTPATDVYFGVVSDIQQPLFGGFQLTPQFIDDPQEPHHLLEKGWMGGPSEQRIEWSFLPKEGPVLNEKLDRWGEKK